MLMNQWYVVAESRLHFLYMHRESLLEIENHILHRLRTHNKTYQISFITPRLILPIHYFHFIIYIAIDNRFNMKHLSKWVGF